MLTDFQNSSSDRLSSKFLVNQYLSVPPNLKKRRYTTLWKVCAQKSQRPRAEQTCRSSSVLLYLDSAILKSSPFSSPHVQLQCSAVRQQDGLPQQQLNQSQSQTICTMDLPTAPPNNKPKLFAGYKSKMSVTPGTTESVIDVLGRYLSNELDIDTSCLRPTFWREHPKYGRLTLGALRALSVFIECTSEACLQLRRHLHETT